MEMLMLKRYGIPEFYIGSFIRPDSFHFYVIQYFPKAFVTNEIRTRTVFTTDSAMIVENIYRRDRGCRI